MAVSAADPSTADSGSDNENGVRGSIRELLGAVDDDDRNGRR